jgi:hypothetical protein
MTNKGVKIYPCTCLNKWQDKEYGKGNRLHNYCNRPNSTEEMKGLRCTVCGSTKGI